MMYHFIPFKSSNITIGKVWYQNRVYFISTICTFFTTIKINHLQSNKEDQFNKI
jgi:hypothetical protein